MIHEVGIEVQAALRKRGCPIPVVDRLPTKPTSWGRQCIVIEHAEAGDRFDPPRGQHQHPRHRFTRKIGVKVTIYAQSTSAGALEFEHRRRAEHVLDLVLVALSDVARVRRNEFLPIAGRFVQPADLEGSDKFGGVVYELTCTLDRAVIVQTWAGESEPTVSIRRVAMSGTPALTFASPANTITRTSGSWLTDGFVIGDTVHVDGTSANDIVGEVTALTDAVMTLATTTLLNEGPVIGATVRTGGIGSITKVSVSGGPDDDNNPTTVPASAEIACGA
jgi:hypothetical protein